MMNRRSLLILLVCLISTRGTLSAQYLDLKFEHIGFSQGLPQSTIHGIAKDKYGFMWFGTWAGLCRYDGYNFKVYRFDPRNNRSINSNRIHNIIMDSNKELWILTFKGDEFCRYNYERDDFERIPVEKVSKKFRDLINRFRHYTSVNVSFGGFKWLLDYEKNALYRQQISSGKKTYYDSNPSDKWSLTDKYVVDIYKDDQNIFWAGTYSNGINKANLHAKPFEYFFHDPSNRNSIVDNNVRAICEDRQGRLWIGTWDKGLSVIDKGKYTHIQLKVADSTNLSHNQVKTIFCDSRGVIWIGTKAGLVRYTPSTKAFKYYDALFVHHDAGKRRIQSGVFGITEDRNGNVWFGASYLGVCKYIWSEDRLQIDYRNTPGSIAKVIIIDRRGQIWVGTEELGVSVFQSTNGKLTPVKTFQAQHKDIRQRINDDRIACLYEDKTGIIWIGTGNGLNCYNPATDKITHLSSKSELNHIMPAGIIEDDNGYLWISHKSGISQVNKKTLQIRNYTMGDGLQGNEFSDNLAYESTISNKLYFGGNNGFTCFKPESIKTDKTLPRTVITELNVQNNQVEIGEKINGRTILIKPLYLTKEVILNYSDKTFALKFSGLHYANPMVNKYAYMLEGFDKDWIYTDAGQRIASYSNLEPGDYVFKVMSSNADGIWNKQPAVLTIKVMPPFWASSWAYCIYLVLALFAAWLYHHHSTKFANLKSRLAYEELVHEKENQLHQSKVDFFTNISHEIKTPLTLILAPLERLMNSFSKNTQVHTQLMTMKLSSDRLLKLVNQLLDFRRLETGHLELNLARHDIISFLSKSVTFFAEEARNRAIKLEFVHEVDNCTFLYDEDKLDKAVSNLLSNALKFTASEGWAKVSFHLKSNEERQLAIIEVKNLGRGVSADEQDLIFLPFRRSKHHKVGGTGIGLAYSKGLIELHGGSIRVVSLPVNDVDYETTFIVELPLKNEANASQLCFHISDASIRLSDQPFVIDKELKELVENNTGKIVINGRTPLLLIVEDNIELRSYLVCYFYAFYDVVDAENGKSGLQIAQSQLPDIIISDIMMDELDGFEFCRAIKSDAKTSHIPLILMTAKTPVENEIEGFETGADDYITKPFNLSALSARVKNLLLLRNRLKEKYRREMLLSPHENVPISVDEKMLKRLMQFIEENLTTSLLSVEEICNGIGISKSNLYRKLKDLTGLTLFEIIKEIRLKRAKQLLVEGKFSVNEITHLVGFADVGYFRKCFRAEFSMSPTQYIKKAVEESESI